MADLLTTARIFLGDRVVPYTFSTASVAAVAVTAVDLVNLDLGWVYTAELDEGEGDDPEPGVTIDPDPTAHAVLLMAMQTAWLLLDEWWKQNVGRKGGGVRVRSGLSSIDTTQQARYTSEDVERAEARYRGLMQRVRMAEAQGFSVNLLEGTGAEDD